MPQVLMPPQFQHPVFAAGGHHGAVGAPVHRKNLVRMTGQVKLKLPRPHVPDLQPANRIIGVLRCGEEIFGSSCAAFYITQLDAYLERAVFAAADKQSAVG